MIPASPLFNDVHEPVTSIFILTQITLRKDAIYSRNESPSFSEKRIAEFKDFRGGGVADDLGKPKHTIETGRR
jgi:hypothetical protein